MAPWAGHARPLRQKPRVCRGQACLAHSDRGLPMNFLVFLEHYGGEFEKGGLGCSRSGFARRRDRRRARGRRGGQRRAPAHGASKVYVAEDDALGSPLPQPRVDALAALVEQTDADAVLFAASVLAADVAAGLAARLDAGLNWDLTDLEVSDGELVGKRPALGDTVLVDVGWTGGPPRARSFGNVRSGRVRRDADVEEFSPSSRTSPRLRRSSSRRRRSRAGPRSRTPTSSSPAAAGSARRRRSRSWKSWPRRSVARSPRPALSSTRAGTRTRRRSVRRARPSRRSFTSPAGSPARSSTRSGCRARAPSSPSTRPRTHRSSTSATSASSATCTRSCRSSPSSRAAIAVARPADFPPPYGAIDAIGVPTAPPDERIEVGVLIVGGGPGGLGCAIRLGQLSRSTRSAGAARRGAGRGAGEGEAAGVAPRLRRGREPTAAAGALPRPARDGRPPDLRPGAGRGGLCPHPPLLVPDSGSADDAERRQLHPLRGRARTVPRRAGGGARRRGSARDGRDGAPCSTAVSWRPNRRQGRGRHGEPLPTFEPGSDVLAG